MSSLNQVTLIGRVGKDPDIRSGNNGSIVNLTIATSETWKDKNTGEKKEQTEWHRVSIFGPAANFVGDYVKKGSRLCVHGQLKTRKWTDKDGKDQYTTEVVVSGYTGKVILLDSKGGNAETSNTPPSQGKQPKNDWGSNQSLDDEIPF